MPASFFAGAQRCRDDDADRFFARRQLADSLHTGVADVDLAIEEHATKLDRFIRLLLIEQRPCDRADRGLAVDQGAGPVEKRLESLNSARRGSSALGQRDS